MLSKQRGSRNWALSLWGRLMIFVWLRNTDMVTVQSFVAEKENTAFLYLICD